MTDTPQDTPTMPPQQKGRLAKLLPLLAIATIAVIGAVTLKDYLSFADCLALFNQDAGHRSLAHWKDLCHAVGFHVALDSKEVVERGGNRGECGHFSGVCLVLALICCGCVSS